MLLKKCSSSSRTMTTTATDRTDGGATASQPASQQAAVTTATAPIRPWWCFLSAAACRRGAAQMLSSSFGGRCCCWNYYFRDGVAVMDNKAADSDNDDANIVCPLCMEDLDATDRNFFPCPCDYQICVFCLSYIQRTLNGRCPACRREYKENAFRTIAPNQSTAPDGTRKGKLKAEKNLQGAVAPNFAHLRDVRVLQRNLTYVVGLPASLASRKDLLVSLEYFGRYGFVENLVVSPVGTTASSSALGEAMHYTAYVTYGAVANAVDAICDIDGASIEGRVLKASFGTTKYCSYFLRDIVCTRPNCFYLHKLGDYADSFTREQMVSSRTAFSDKALQRNMSANPAAMQVVAAAATNGNGDAAPTTLYRWQIARHATATTAASGRPKLFGIPVDERLLREAERTGLALNPNGTLRTVRRRSTESAGCPVSSSPRRGAQTRSASQSRDQSSSGKGKMLLRQRHDWSALAAANLSRQSSGADEVQASTAAIRKPSTDFPSLRDSVAAKTKPNTVWKKRTDSLSVPAPPDEGASAAPPSTKATAATTTSTAAASAASAPPPSAATAETASLPSAAASSSPQQQHQPSSDTQSATIEQSSVERLVPYSPSKATLPFVLGLGVPSEFEIRLAGVPPPLKPTAEEMYLRQEQQQQAQVAPAQLAAAARREVQQQKIVVYEALRQHMRSYEDALNAQYDEHIRTVRAQGDEATAAKLQAEKPLHVDHLIKARVDDILRSSPALGAALGIAQQLPPSDNSAHFQQQQQQQLLQLARLKQLQQQQQQFDSANNFHSAFASQRGDPQSIALAALLQQQQQRQRLQQLNQQQLAAAAAASQATLANAIMQQQQQQQPAAPNHQQSSMEAQRLDTSAAALMQQHQTALRRLLAAAAQQNENLNVGNSLQGAASSLEQQQQVEALLLRQRRQQQQQMATQQHHVQQLIQQQVQQAQAAASSDALPSIELIRSIMSQTSFNPVRNQQQQQAPQQWAAIAP